MKEEKEEKVGEKVETNGWRREGGHKRTEEEGEEK